MEGLTFYYGVMGCSKSANALMTRFQYSERGNKVLLIKPATDTRDDKGGKIVIKSRVGIEAEAIAISKPNQISELFYTDYPNVVICDEAQFLTVEQVEELKHISSFIPVLCYGLRTDFQTHLFPGSRRLFELADNIQEIESVCSCGRKAIVNARLDSEGNVVTEGNQVELGGDDKYIALCWDCYQRKIR